MANEQPKRVVSPDTLRPERIPPGQHLTDEWPILHYSSSPAIDIEKWELRIFGLVEKEVRLSWEEFRSLCGTSLPSAMRTAHISLERGTAGSRWRYWMQWTS